MLKSQLKLILPFLALLLSFIAFFEAVWIPHLLTKQQSVLLDGEQRVLNQLAGRVLPLLDQGDTLHGRELLQRELAATPQWLKLSVRGGATKGWLNVSRSGAYYLDNITLRIESGGYHLELLIDRQQLLSNELGVLRMAEVVTVLVLLLMMILMMLVQRAQILTPLEQLGRAARHLSRGDFHYPLPEGGRNRAINSCVSAFASMRDSIASKQQQLQCRILERHRTEERLRASHQVAGIGCWEWRPKEKHYWASESLYPMFGLAAEEVLTADRFLNQIHPADRVAVQRQFRQSVRRRANLQLEYRLSGSLSGLHIQMLGQCELDENGCLIRIYGTCQDVTERKGIEGELHRLSSAITHSGSAVIITDIIGSIEYVNPKFVELTGFSMEETVGQQPEMLSRRWMSSEKYEALWQALLAGKHWRGELQSNRKDGSSFWSLVSISPVKNEFDELTHFVIVSEDVTELKEAHARMERLAHYDELCGLPNRRCFQAELEQTLQNRGLNKAAVLLLDLDHFKTINDTQGHQVGDQLLQQVAFRLQKNIDGKGAMAARLGGDEFAILVRSFEDVRELELLASAVITSLVGSFTVSQHELQISTSIGIAVIPDDGSSADILMQHADLAMYRAKELGRGRFRFFTQQMYEELQRYIRVSHEMPLALRQQQFDLVFQPQQELDTGNITSFEALIRWQHPEHGVISPVDFINVAEETGFIVPLGRWVLRQACQMLRTLTENGFESVRVAVNLSARQFRDPALLEMVAAALQEFSVEANRLEVEITETLLMHDIDQAIATLRALQEMGVTVAIDDFGIGYSSFGYLKNLPINAIKVDREFIKDIPDHQDDMEITAAIISMTHRLGLTVVAEGIETEVQRCFLQEHRCDLGQGYQIGRPMASDLAIEFLNVHSASIEEIAG